MDECLPFCRAREISFYSGLWRKVDQETRPSRVGFGWNGNTLVEMKEVKKSKSTKDQRLRQIEISNLGFVKTKN